MPGNPLTDPNWAPDLADTVERVVGTVREKTTDNVVKAARTIVFGLLGAVLGITALILLVIIFTRGLQSLLDFAVTPGRPSTSATSSSAESAASLGVLLMKKRHSDATTA